MGLHSKSNEYVIRPILAVPFHIRLYVLVGQDDSMVPVDLMTYNGKEDLTQHYQLLQIHHRSLE